MAARCRHRTDFNRRNLLAGALGVAAGIALVSSRQAEARGVVGPAIDADEKFMRMAIEEAALGDYPYGAVIVANGDVVGRGHNLTGRQQDPTAHGEMVAIRNVLAAHGPEKMKGTTIYCSGEACAMCMGAIVWCGFGRVVFAASVSEIARKTDQMLVTNVEVADKSPWTEIDITGGVLAAESLALFK